MTESRKMYPVRGNTDILYLADPRVDFALRETAIHLARHSVDFICFAQTPDEIGMRFLQALRAASGRGVRVRGMFEKLPSMGEKDRRFESPRYLTDPDLARPAELVCGRTLAKWKAGLAFDDFIHEKILILDA